MLTTAFTSVLLCLSINIYHEARDQGYDGMAATAIVVMERANYEPEAVCDVVFKPKQFSWANRLTTAPTQAVRNEWAAKLMPKEINAYNAARDVAYQALTDQLDSEIVASVGSADHYFNPSKADPQWQHHMDYIVKVGDHAFYNSKSNTLQLASSN